MIDAAPANACCPPSASSPHPSSLSAVAAWSITRSSLKAPPKFGWFDPLAKCFLGVDEVPGGIDDLNEPDSARTICELHEQSREVAP
jgi:hypothetical protein